MPLKVVLDTNVLYPRHLRLAFLNLTDADTKNGDEGSFSYAPLWSPGILEELRDKLVKTNATSEWGAKLILAEIRSWRPEAEIHDYQHLVSSMTCHSGDRHVLAAAVHASADMIITRNTRDYPPASVVPYGVGVLDPDDFLMSLFYSSTEAVIAVIDELVAVLRADKDQPDNPQTRHELCRALTDAGTPRFAAALRGQR